MSKRRLTRKQAWRIEKIQQERTERARRRDDGAEAVLQAGNLGPEQDGVVVAHFGSQAEIEGADGLRQRCHLRTHLEGLVTGDRVVWCAGEPTGVVVARKTRQNALSRPDNCGNLKPIAANIDRVFIVIAPLPEPHANLIDRYLVAAEATGAHPVIVVNKTDLLETDAELAANMSGLLAVYPSLGYTPLPTHRGEDGLSQLIPALAGHTSVLVGQSGVGKSSLINALLPGVDLRVGALSGTRNKGVHTTTTAQLFHLSCGGSLIDSPGIREFGLWHMEREQIETGFIEFRPHLGHCRFRDCKHREEPGCALLAAVARGEISQQRFQSYRRILSDQ